MRCRRCAQRFYTWADLSNACALGFVIGVAAWGACLLIFG